MFEEPFIYQTECLVALEGARANGIEKGLAVLASGLGKTVMSALDAKARLTRKDGKLLYLCHQNLILDQACLTFKEILGDNRRYGFFNGLENSMHKADTVFASLQTIRGCYKNFRPEEFDHIIVDESHHSHAITYLAPVEYFKPRWKLGLTATPDRCDGRNIRSIFGNELYYLPLEEALVRELVTDVDYRPITEELLIDGVNFDTLNLSADTIDDKVFVRKRDEEIADIITRHAKDISDPKIIIFANSIARAGELAKVIPCSAMYHSKIPIKERLVRLELFKLGIIQTLITIDCFNEGVDIPEANVIVFLRSTSSPTIFLQQLGRGLRRFPGKSKVIVLDFVSNCERITRLKDFTELIERCRKAYEQRTHTHVSRVTGAFSIVFDEKAIKVLDVLKRIRPTKIADAPDLLKEYSQRNTFSASHLSAKTSREVWWTCEVCGLEYKMSARLKLSGKQCPKCEDQVTETNNLAFARPEFAKEYDSSNPLPPDKIRIASRDPVTWNCGECGFKYIARVRARVYRGDGCPKCATSITFYKSNMAFMLPHLQEEYSDVNILSPNRIHQSSNKSVWWICKKCGRDYTASAFARSVGHGNCPDCISTKATPVSNIMLTHPHLAEEYSSRNRKAVETVSGQSTDSSWWLCFECGRYWEATVAERINGKKCSCSVGKTCTSEQA